MSALAIVLPARPDDLPYWRRIADDAIAAHGIGEDWGEPGDTDEVTLIAPARAVTLHRASLPDLAPRQAAAAARLMALENSVGSPELLHVASGSRESDGGVDIAVVHAADMAGWLQWAQHRGIDPKAVVPAGLLLPRPDEGFVAGTVGDEAILRDVTSTFADDGLGEAIVGQAPVRTVPADEIEAALIAAVRAPPLDLRQGAFARRRRRDLDWGLVRRAAVLAGLILLASLGIALARIARLDASTASLDAATVAAGRQVAPNISTADQAQAAVNAKLVQRGLGGRGFSAPAAQLFAAMQNVQGAGLSQLQRTADGTLAATLTAARPEDVDTVLLAIRQAGYVATADAPQNQGGQSAVPITVMAP